MTAPLDSFTRKRTAQSRLPLTQATGSHVSCHIQPKPGRERTFSIQEVELLALRKLEPDVIDLNLPAGGEVGNL